MLVGSTSQMETGPGVRQKRDLLRSVMFYLLTSKDDGLQQSEWMWIALSFYCTIHNNCPTFLNTQEDASFNTDMFVMLPIT